MPYKYLRTDITACVQGFTNGNIGNFTNGTIGVPMVPLVSNGEPMAPLSSIGTNGIANGTIGRTLKNIGIPLVPLVEP